jgi:hypothetical protein
MSSLGLVGSTFSAAGLTVPLDEQSPGSLTTTYEGTLTADVDLNALTIMFMDDGTDLIADNSGDWTPQVGGDIGTAPGNYGDQFNFPDINYSAIRGLVVSVVDIAVNSMTQNADGSYAIPATQYLTFNTGSLDYNTTVGFGQGTTTSIDGISGLNGADNGTLVDNGDGTLTVTVLVNTSLFWDIGSGATADFILTGSITATSLPPPRPSGGLHQGAEQSLSLAALPAGQAPLSTPLANGLETPVAPSAASVPSTATSLAVTTSPVQNSPLQAALSQSTHQGGTLAPHQIAAVDAVFQDAMQSAPLQDAFIANGSF